MFRLRKTDENGNALKGFDIFVKEKQSWDVPIQGFQGFGNINRGIFQKEIPKDIQGLFEDVILADV
jgi:hypothetical protein